MRKYCQLKLFIETKETSFRNIYSMYEQRTYVKFVYDFAKLIIGNYEYPTQTVSVFRNCKLRHTKPRVCR